MTLRKELPMEILYKIFEYNKLEVLYSDFNYDEIINDDSKSSYECALVYKAWLRPVQLTLYNTVKITSKQSLNLFLSTLVQNNYLVSMVKTIELRKIVNEMTIMHSTSVEKLFALLPNLENLKFNPNITDYFATLLNSLLDSQLIHLKRIPEPSWDSRTYSDFTTCVLLMKDRIEVLNFFAYEQDRS
jgi:hypothetical protein